MDGKEDRENEGLRSTLEKTLLLGLDKLCTDYAFLLCS